MNKLTLPIQDTKKYVQRSGNVVITGHSQGAYTYVFGSGAVYTNTGLFHGRNDEYSKYDLVSDYVEVVLDVPVSHVHAASMLQYAEDAAGTDKPWERWEFRDYACQPSFEPLEQHPGWTTTTAYRRKLPVPKTFFINDFKIPEPTRVALEYGTKYWCIQSSIPSISVCTWTGDEVDRFRLDKGIVHLTREAAQLHTDALLSFTANKS